MKEDRIITEECLQCGEQYVPTRKGAQKFCSASCRSRHWSLKKNEKPKLTPQEFLDQAFEKQGQIKVKEEDKAPVSIEKMSASGVGNSFWGSLAAEVVTGVAKNALKRESDKLATKGDLKILLDRLNQRFLPVQNVSDQYGNKAFYDKELFKIVFYNEQLRRFETPILDL